MMKCLKYYLLLLVLLGGFLACNKIEITPDQIGEIVFRMNLNDGSNDILLQAGEMDYYMFSDWRKDQDEVVELYGTLKHSDCDTECGPAISIFFRNTDDSNQDELNVNEVIKTGNYSIYSIQPNYANQTVLNMSAVPGGIPPFEYAWDLGDGFTSNDANVSHVYLDQNSTYNVQLEVSDALDCVSTVNRTVNLNQQNTDCSFTLLVQDSVCLGIPNTTCAFAIPLSGVPPFSYLWSNGDSTEIVIIPTDSISMGSYCVTMTDGLGCTSTNCLNYNIDLSGSFGHTNFCSSRINVSYENLQIPINSPQFGSVRIEYTDENGELFSTDEANQEALDFFRINEVEDYLTNEKGLPTKKIEIDFEVSLRSRDGKALKLKANNGVFGIAYPK